MQVCARCSLPPTFALLTRKAAAVPPAALALPGQVHLRMQSSCHCSHTMHSAQHAIDQRVIEKLNVTHVINASNRIDNYHVATGSSAGTSFGCSRFFRLFPEANS